MFFKKATVEIKKRERDTGKIMRKKEMEKFQHTSKKAKAKLEETSCSSSVKGADAWRCEDKVSRRSIALQIHAAQLQVATGCE